MKDGRPVRRMRWARLAPIRVLRECVQVAGVKPVVRKELSVEVYGLDELRGYLDRLAAYRREYGTDGRPFEVQASVVDRMPTPDVCAELAAMGVTTLITSAWMMEGLRDASRDENVRALERFGEKYIAPLR